MDQKDKRYLALIFSMSVINGLLSVVGIASILPFVGLISEPELFDSNQYVLVFREFTGLQTYQSVVVCFGILSFLLIFLGNLLGAFDDLILAKFGYIKEQQLSKKLLENYLKTDDLTFKGKKNSERVKSVLADVDRVILDTLFAMIDMVSGIILALFVFTLLLFVDVQATLVITLSLTSVYLIVYTFAAKKLDRLGREFADIETDMYGEVLEALNLQREIKIADQHQYFTERYSDSFGEMIRNRMSYEILSIFPQRAIEVIIFGSILAIAIFFTLYETSNMSAIAMIGMYAFATYRLMPAISEIFDSFEQIQFGSAILRKLVKEFKQKKYVKNQQNISFENAIKLENISFSYSKKTKNILNNISLDFAANKFHCIVGETGCGKSTLLDLIAGFYQPKAGKFFLDGKEHELYENKVWQSFLGYVPVQVKLIEASIYENVALGIDFEDIDKEKVKKLLKFVELDKHIESLPDNYETYYGDRGLAFSSGQIQKMGIARALYQDPKVLLFDEVTDAFDKNTEIRFLEKLKSLNGKTIIFVSHRQSVCEYADNIIELEKILVN